MSSCARKTQQDINNEWNAMAGEWDDMAAGYRNSFFEKLWEETGLDASAQRVVVDFGCGTGLLTDSLRKSSPLSEFICIDAALAMVRVLKEKIQSFGWEDNVRAHCVALARVDTAGGTIKMDIESLKGKVDLIVASSVMSFIPAADLKATMEILGGLLKPGTGVFCHSDWPVGEDHPDGFNDEKAGKMYAMAGLEMEKTSTIEFKMGSSHRSDVFFGVAVRGAK